MIYTVTLNPALDYVMWPQSFDMGKTNRTKNEEIYVGGKGINVSLILKELGVKSKAIGFVAGFTGAEIEKRLKKRGIKTDFIKLKSGNTRINVKIKGENETELNAAGPKPSEKEQNALYKKLGKLKNGDTLVLSGAVPSGMPEDTYEKILERLKNKKIRIVVDAGGEFLKKTLSFKPWLIKPNTQELSEMFGVELKEHDDIVKHAILLRKMGAQNVIVSMAEKGAIFVGENNEPIFCPALEGEVVNSVGAGDSFVAGFIAGMKSNDEKYALSLATASGGATAFSNDLATKQEILNQLDKIKN